MATTLRGGWGSERELAGRINASISQTTPTIRSIQPGRWSHCDPSRPYGLWGGNVGFNTPSRALTVSANVGAGMGVIFAEAAESRGLNSVVGVTWKPTPSVRVDGRWTHQTLRRAADGSWFSTANIPRLKIEYQLRRDIFFRYVGQYTAQEVDALRDPRYGYPSSTTAGYRPYRDRVP
jgi:hypothetical protein